ncbi:FAD dependent oxidoreductase [Delitschia confertaspora ATCC 74209]|uniref:FAD dependent oxidoreductase n=1 Tax=Delitschia confertaspora ATCC 74209 TaxID=1513339 RepID=A0A9P4JQM5_9PLEO|nr:FAD dependent oxidoreductase [Delitschia confertaspora ATCC 74209]
MTPVNKEDSILIIGAGTWGCSIALNLARRGFKNIKVLDACPFPSAISAGNDLNKIAEEGTWFSLLSPPGANPPKESDTNEDYFWPRIHQLAMNGWKNDPLLRPFYHPTGFIHAAVSDDAYENCLRYAREEGDKVIPLNSKEDFQATMPEGVATGSFPGWRGFWKKEGAGWVFASGAMKAMHAEAVKLGVEFVSGDPEGKVHNLIKSPSGDAILGARTAEGREHRASHTILAAGANSDEFLDFKKQLRPTAWTLAHLPLTADEKDQYKNLPVLYGVDRGFFIEPDAEKYEIKICDEHSGYCNFVKDLNGELRSIPFARQQIPKEAEARMRQLLQETMPQLADRKFTFARICWDAYTMDRRFLIDRHPDLKNLILAVGGSGHGFMTNPAIGLLVGDILEDKIEPRLQKMMRWRPEQAVDRDWWATQNRFGEDGKVMDFEAVKEWTEIGDSEVGKF